MKTKAHQRYKTKDGKVVPGVTTIIDANLGWNKRALMAWARREALKGNDPDLIAQEAAESGTLAHYLVECHIKDTKPDVGDYSPNQLEAAQRGYDAFLDWEAENEVEYLEIEKKVVHEELRYGGTIDIIAKHDGRLWLIDLKTSKGLYPEMVLQTAAYAEGYESQENVHIDECFLLQLNKTDGDFHYKRISHEARAAAWRVFRNLLEIHKLKGKI